MYLNQGHKLQCFLFRIYYVGWSERSVTTIYAPIKRKVLVRHAWITQVPSHALEFNYALWRHIFVVTPSPSPWMMVVAQCWCFQPHPIPLHPQNPNQPSTPLELLAPVHINSGQVVWMPEHPASNDVWRVSNLLQRPTYRHTAVKVDISRDYATNPCYSIIFFVHIHGSVNSNLNTIKSK